MTECGKLCTWIDASLWTCRGLEKPETAPGTVAAAEPEPEAEEEPVENLCPMIFHGVKGRNVETLDGGTRAKKTTGYNNATTFTALPVLASKSGERRFELIIEKHRTNSYAGSIRVGFTATDPSSLPSGCD